jgi:hypothetical protein
MPAERIATSVEIMKKISEKTASSKKAAPRRRPTQRQSPDDLRAHYDFDYSKSQPNRFASKLGAKAAVVIVLDPDVAEVFNSAASVNTFLRSAIAAMPSSEAAKKRRAS